MRDRGNDIEQIKTKWLVLLQMKIFFPFLSCPTRHKWSWIFSSKTLNLTLNTAGDPHILKCSAPTFLSLTQPLHWQKKHTHSHNHQIQTYNFMLYCVLHLQNIKSRLCKYNGWTSTDTIYRYRALPGLFQSIGSLNGCQYQPLILRAKRNMSNTLRHNMAHHHVTSCSWWWCMMQHQKVAGLGTAGCKRCEMNLARGHMKYSTFKAFFPLWLATLDT